MDLYFQGMAWLNKGHAPENVAQAHRCFDRALIADPGNVEALVGSARADSVDGINLFVTDPAAALAAAEAKLIKALSSVPDHPRGHMWLGLVELWTKRAAEVIAVQRRLQSSLRVTPPAIPGRHCHFAPTEEAHGAPGTSEGRRVCPRPRRMNCSWILARSPSMAAPMTLFE